jgi:predicted glutamine amidotransferase
MPVLAAGAALLSFALLVAGLSTHRGDPPAPHNCRLWALVGRDYPAELIPDQLRDGSPTNLMQLGTSNDDGWGIGYLPHDSAGVALQMPVLRRGEPHAAHPHEPEYGLAVAEIAELPPRAAIAHVRWGTSGHFGIPNPHPFLHQGMLFAHNGMAIESGLEEFLDKYLTGHPPDYTQGVTGTGHIDSELLFLALLKSVAERPELAFAEALAAGAAALAADPQIFYGSPSFNFVLTRGDTLYALHCYGSGSSNPLVFAPPAAPVSTYWVVASEALGSADYGWTEIAPRTLGVFVPGEAPRFLSLDAAAAGAPSPAGGAPRGPKGTVTREAAADRGADDAAHNCRFWSVVGDGYASELVTEHLRDGSHRNLRELGETNDDGWGIGYFLPADARLPLQTPLIRRGGPAASNNHEAEYGLAVAELAAILPPAAIAHVRRGTSGHYGIPDPHPFQHRGILFAHNGGLEVDELEDRLGGFLTRNPPDYVAGAPGTGHIDSELYMLYLLKLIDEQPGETFTSALLSAVRTIVVDEDLHDDYEPLLNFVLTRGDTLYALQYYGPGYNLEHYYPASAAGGAGEKEASPFWVVASESLGWGGGGWAAIPSRTLAVFVPGEAPAFLAVDDPQLSLAGVWVTLTGDQDGDGYFTELEICGDPDCLGGSLQASLSLEISPDGASWIDVGSTRYRTIQGTAADSLCLGAASGGADWPDTLAASLWQGRVALYTPGVPDPVVVATAGSHPEWGLGDLPLEGAAQDTLPEAGSLSVGEVRPNPTTGGFQIPMTLPGGADRVRLELYTIDGACLWRGIQPVAGEQLSWSPDEAGVYLHAGVYFARIAFGGRDWMRRVVVAR